MAAPNKFKCITVVTRVRKILKKECVMGPLIQRKINVRELILE